jgi:DNA-binding MarR family transcriptional regulator
VATTLMSGEEVDLLISILKVASTIGRPMKEGVADPGGVSSNELRVLMCLGGEGQMAGHEMGELIGMQPMNISRALAALAARGWVEQVPDTENRRRKPHQLSAVGAAAYAEMTPQLADVASFLFAGLNDRERESLSKVMTKLGRRIRHWGES